MNESRPSAAASWLIAAIAVLGSAGWMAWQWFRQPPDMETVRLYVDGKAWERAAPMLEEVIACDPGNAEATRLLALSYRQLERPLDGARVLAGLRGDAEETAAARFFAGQSLLAGNRRRDAEKMWNQVLASESAPGVEEWKQECRRELCNVYAVERRRREFLAATSDLFDHALPKDRFLPLQYRMRYLVNMVEPNSAIKKLEPVLAADPDDLFTRAAIGTYLVDLDKSDEALARLKECRAKAPDELTFWEQYCQVLDKRGDDKAIVEAVAAIPGGAEQSAVAEHMKAIAAEQRGDLSAALQHLDRSLALDPHPGKHQRKGQLLMKLHKTEEGKRELNLAARQQPAFGDAREFILRGQQEGTPDDGRVMAEWAAEAATLMEKMERFDDARRWRLAALGADPNHRPSLLALERDAARRFGRD